MQKINSNDIIDKALFDKISNEILHHTCQLFKKTKEGMRPHGSGVLVEIKDEVVLLTASHVTDGVSDNDQLYFRIHGGYVSCVGGLQETDISIDETIDLAYVILDREVAENLRKGYRILPVSKIRRHNELLDAGQYCVIGFPEKNQKVESGVLRTGASIFILEPSSDKVYRYYGFEKRACYILDLKGKGKDFKTGEISKIDTNVYGMSGCGLWLMLVEQVGEEYNVDYRLIGVMTEFRKGKYHCLIGNRIELIMSQLKSMGFLNYRFRKIE